MRFEVKTMLDCSIKIAQDSFDNLLVKISRSMHELTDTINNKVNIGSSDNGILQRADSLPI